MSHHVPTATPAACRYHQFNGSPGNTVTFNVTLGQGEGRLGSHPSSHVCYSSPVRRSKSLAEVLIVLCAALFDGCSGEGQQRDHILVVIRHLLKVGNLGRGIRMEAAARLLEENQLPQNFCERVMTGDEPILLVLVSSTRSRRPVS